MCRHIFIHKTLELHCAVPKASSKWSFWRCYMSRFNAHKMRNRSTSFSWAMWVFEGIEIINFNKKWQICITVQSVGPLFVLYWTDRLWCVRSVAPCHLSHVGTIAVKLKKMTTYSMSPKTGWLPWVQDLFNIVTRSAIILKDALKEYFGFNTS